MSKLIKELNTIDQHYTYETSKPGFVRVACKHTNRGICNLTIQQAQGRLDKGYAKQSRAYQFITIG